MIGISMFFTIAICVGSFSVIYAGLDDVVGDFVSRAAPDNTPTPLPTEVAEAEDEEEPAPEPTDEPEPEPTNPPDEGENDNPEPTEEAADNDDGNFQPDYQVDSTGSVNFRSGPGTEFEILYSVPLEEPLEYLGESAPTQNPDADGLGEGQVWMQFQTEDGDEGWIREIDVTEYVP